MGNERTRPKRDVVLVYGRAKKKGAYKVLRAREERLELGELREAKEGERVDGDLVKLKPREDDRQLFDVEVVAPASETTASPPAAPERDGPAQVASDSYRKNWDEVFGDRKKPRHSRYLN